MQPQCDRIWQQALNSCHPSNRRFKIPAWAREADRTASPASLFPPASFASLCGVWCAAQELKLHHWTPDERCQPPSQLMKRGAWLKLFRWVLCTLSLYSHWHCGVGERCRASSPSTSPHCTAAVEGNLLAPPGRRPLVQQLACHTPMVSASPSCAAA